MDQQGPPQRAAAVTGRYRRLPTGAHGLDPEEVRRDQRERLQTALIELIAERGYQAVRILDLTKLARVSRPTFYSLYADKEELFLAAYDEIVQRADRTIMAAYRAQGSPGERLRQAIRAFAELAAAEPDAVSLMVLGALGAGPRALERRHRTLGLLEQSIPPVRAAGGASGARRKPSSKRVTRGSGRPTGANGREGTGANGHEGARGTEGDMTVKVILGGIREVTAARLRRGQARELPGLAEELAEWAESYPTKPPAGLTIGGTHGRAAKTASEEGRSGGDRSGGGQPRGGQPAGGLPGGGQPAGKALRGPDQSRAAELASERARQAEGRLPSGRHDLPRQFIVKNQRERIVDATAAIVAEKGLQALTIPEIARRANVSHQTFYEMYPTKEDAFLGAQKVGLHQALGVAVRAYEAQGEDWPGGVAAGIRALLDYLASEPAHAHLTVVDTFAASPSTIEIRDTGLQAFSAYLQPGYHHAPPSHRVPGIVPEAVAGGIWQVLHNHIENERVEDISDLAPQMTYFALTPFIGAKDAARVARRRDLAVPDPT
ncbi:MAG TPA: TetR/AcrR family transcriptional regulator [Solirubrobacteraceae bacterium]|nr:TetR/AcrR family transcriptional regulator [Solirubrobacteraceae bacterium]